MTSGSDEVTEELRKIYQEQREKGYWIKEWGKGDHPDSKFMAAAGCFPCLEKIEEETGRDIKVKDLTLGDCISLSYPGTGKTREEACREAIKVLREEHTCTNK